MEQAPAAVLTDTNEISRLRDEVERLSGELRANRQLLSETTLSHIPDFAYLFNLEGRFIYVNRALLRLWRIPLEEALGKNFFELGYPTELAERLQSQINEVIKLKQPIKDFTPFTDPAGETRHYEYIFVPVLAEDGLVEAVAGSTRDVTDLKLSESQRSRGEALLQMVIDNVPGLVSYLDSDLRYQFTNRRYSEWFPGSLAGRQVAEVVGEKAFECARPYMERALAGEPVCFDEYLPYTSAKGRHVRVTYTPDRRDGQTVNGVVAMVQDITEQKRMEEALRESKERLQQVFSQAPVAVAVLRGPEMIFELVNPLYQSFFPGRELLNRPLLEAIPEIGELNAELLSILSRVLETGDPFVAQEYRFAVDRDADGTAEDVYFTFVYQPLREQDISVSGVVVVAVDVTTHVHARQEQERVNRQLEEFAYVASHDLQEPLRMVNIYSHLLLNPLNSQEKAEKYAGFVREGVKRMEVLISDMLTYSRTVHGEDIATETADLAAAWTEAVSVLKDRIQESGAQITTAPLPVVRGDTAQIAHVFQNLLTNSLKYCRMGSAPEIQVAAEQSGGWWTISVRDNGIGFDQRYAKQIFGLFKRLHKAEYPGTGLGLAICQRIVERYNGRMWADSILGEGATFSFTLQAVKAEAAAPQN